MAKFVVSCGHCAGEYDSVYISTDLEPDDAASFKVLAPRLHGVPLLVVVGEGDKVGKTKMMGEILHQYGIDGQAIVVQGRRSATAYPDSALSSYSASGAPVSKAAISDVVGDDHVAALVQAFLLKHTAPFALVLKPPHELLSVSADALGRTVSAAYGSFNFTVLRQSMRAESPNLTEDEAFGRQESLLHSFKRCLWIERSVSVGTGGTLDTSDASAAAWRPMAEDALLVRLVQAWNERAVSKFGRGLSDIGLQIAAAFEQSGSEAFGVATKSRQPRGRTLCTTVAFLSSFRSLCELLCVCCGCQVQWRGSPRVRPRRRG